MHDQLAQLIKQNFDKEIIMIKRIADHGTTKVYLLESATEKYALKEMGLNDNLENESELMEHLIGKGISVPKIYPTISGSHVFTDNELQYILYEFIEGTMIELNAAPDWFLTKSARTLGQIQNALKDYKRIPPVGFGQDFFSKEKYIRGEQYILDKIKQAEDKNDVSLAIALNERLKHIKRVSCFAFDCDKLTYVVTHGDFYVNQIIVRDGELVVIDWTHPGNVLACFEVLMSYTYAAPECKDGVIDITKFEPYLNEYLKYAPIKLNRYDLKMMPYFIYHYCIFCSFTPPYDDLPIDYFKIAKLTDNLANWLFNNVDILSRDLCKL